MFIIFALSSSAHASNETLNNFLNADATDLLKKEFSLGDHKASMQLYGIIDIGVEHANHAYPETDYLPQGFYPANRQKSAYSTTQTDWFSGGLSQNRIGINADASLFKLDNGVDIKAVLNLETGFNPLGFHLYNGAKSLAQNGGASGTAITATTISNESSQNGQFFKIGRAHV